MIDVDALRVDYPAGGHVGPLSFTAADGLTLLTAPSGAGKSTILRTMAGIIPTVQPATVTGHVRLNGRPRAADAPHRRAGHVGWVPQELTTVTTTPWEEVALPLEHAGWSPGDTADRVDELLESLGVGVDAHRPTAELSGGQQARVVLAAALAARPDALLLDEPLNQLDADGRRRFQETLAGFLDDGGTAVAATHRPELWTLAHERIDLDGQGSASPPVAPRADTGEPVVEADGVRPEGRGVGPFDVTVHEGDAIVLQGDNAAGKTSLLWCLAGIHPVADGTVRLAGQDPTTLPSRERAARLGFSFQDPAWHVTQDTVWQEATLTLRLLGRPAEAAASWLERFGLSPLVDRHPWDLSGGERQRLAVVTALAHDPPVALLDEPTRGMDARHRAALIESVTDRSARGMATVLVTHDETLAAAAARRIHLEAAS